MREAGRAGAPRGLVRRRHVIYVEGYDPQGAQGYYRLFARSWRRFLSIWPLKARLGELQLDTRDFAHWELEAAGPNWRVVTRYDFLRQEHIIRANMAEPLLTRQMPRALAWAFDYLVSGALVRIFRACRDFGLALLHFQIQLLMWIVLSIAGGGLAAFMASRLGLPAVAAVLVGLAVTALIFAALRQVASRTFVIQINNHWPYLIEFARGESSCFDAPVEAGAQRLVGAVRDGNADEIVVIGHSGGGVLAPAVVTRALELDSGLGKRGTPVVLLTLGSIAPGAALHPRAEKLRAVFARLAVEPSITWIDCQSRKDVLNFWNFDPVAGLGLDIGGARCNPLIWRFQFRDMLSPELYRRIRHSFFRKHYQFIMASDRRATYDYLMLVAGPLPVAAWAKDPNATFAAFAEDAALMCEGSIGAAELSR